MLTALPVTAMETVNTSTKGAAYTSGDFTYDTNGVSTITITGYSGIGGALVIPQTLDGYTIIKIDGNVFKNNKRLKLLLKMTKSKCTLSCYLCIFIIK